MKYATEQKFGDQRASVGRVVIVITEDDGERLLTPGIISRIREDDTPLIRTVGSFPSGDDTLSDGKDWGGLVYREAVTEADIEALPVDSWTYPPRV